MARNDLLAECHEVCVWRMHEESLPPISGNGRGRCRKAGVPFRTRFSTNLRLIGRGPWSKWTRRPADKHQRQRLNRPREAPRYPVERESSLSGNDVISWKDYDSHRSSLD